MVSHHAKTSNALGAFLPSFGSPAIKPDA